MTDWVKSLRLAEDELDRIKEKKKPVSNGKQYKMPSGVAGTTSGQVVPHDDEKFQRRMQTTWLKNRGKGNESIKKNFGKATPEQIALRKKKEAKQAAIDARKSARRHRGGYKKTKAYHKLRLELKKKL